MEKVLSLGLLICWCCMQLSAQGIDENSTPPGAPLFKLAIADENGRLMPHHPGNAGERVQASTFTIIESQSFNSGHNMDLQWQTVLQGMGHTALVRPQTALDNTGFFAGTDALIISSGVIALTVPRIGIIQQFVQSGKPVYIQGEYLPTYTSNTSFRDIVNATGGTFATGATIAGDLNPTAILNAFATTTNIVPSINYHWYGCTASGCNNVEYFMRYGANNIGFVYCPTNSGWGDMIQSTDQDWVRAGTSFPLMQNIVYHLLSGNACSLVCGTVLEATSLDLRAQKLENGHARLSWVVDGDLPAGRFQVLVNGEEVHLQEVTSASGHYFSWEDARNANGLQSYQVQFWNQNGQATLAAEVSLDLGAQPLTLRASLVQDGMQVWLNSTQPDLRLWLIHANGQRIALPTADLGKLQGQYLDLRQLPFGLYILLAETPEGARASTKILWMR